MGTTQIGSNIVHGVATVLAPWLNSCDHYWRQNEQEQKVPQEGKELGLYCVQLYPNGSWARRHLPATAKTRRPSATYPTKHLSVWYTNRLYIYFDQEYLSANGWELQDYEIRDMAKVTDHSLVIATFAFSGDIRIQDHLKTISHKGSSNSKRGTMH